MPTKKKSNTKKKGNKSKPSTRTSSGFSSSSNLPVITSGAPDSTLDADSDTLTLSNLNLNLNDNDNETPAHGWVREQKEAKAALKSKNANEESIMRLAKAHYKLRQSDKLQQLEHQFSNNSNQQSTSITMNTSSTRSTTESQIPLLTRITSKNQKIVTQWIKHLNVQPAVNHRDDPYFNYNSLYGKNLDINIVDHPSYCNLNILQFAAIRGDIELLERVVALGAAIDYPVLKGGQIEINHTSSSPQAPEGSNALLLTMAQIAMNDVVPAGVKRMTFRDNPQLADIMRGNLECALQLVNLGADFMTARLKLNNLVSQDNSNMIGLQTLNMLGFDGKNAWELATLAKRPILLRAMKERKSIEGKIEKVHCRCGSRLPWKECHGGDWDHHDQLYQQTPDDRLRWVLSPESPCYCLKAKQLMSKSGNKLCKTYYQCCWKDEPTYQDDVTGNIQSLKHMPITEANRDMVEALKILKETASPDTPIFPNFTKEMFCSQVRNPMFKMVILQKDPDRNSCMHDLDNNILADIVMCMEKDWFIWNDLHWPLKKSEVILRTKEWNEALQQYCNNKGLVGEEREQIVQTYTASPFAPSGNPSCDNVEKEVKGFAKCSRCKEIGYCSHACQKNHWPNHKKMCLQKM